MSSDVQSGSSSRFQRYRNWPIIYEERFRQELRPAFYAWRGTDPFNNPDAPPGPFAMPEYVLAAQLESEELVEEAARLGIIVLMVGMLAVGLYNVFTFPIT